MLLEHAAQNGSEKALVKLGMLLASMNLDNTIFTSTDTLFLPSSEGEGEMAKQYKDRLIIGYTPDSKPITVWVTGKSKMTFYDNVFIAYAENNMSERLGYKVVKLEDLAVHVKTEAPPAVTEALPAVHEKTEAPTHDILTFRQYTEKWFLLRRDSWRLNSIKSYESVLLTHFYPYFGDLPLKDISWDIIQQYLNERHEMSKETLRTHTAKLKAIFESALEDGKISTNPAKHRNLRNPGKAMPQREALTAEERQKIINALPNMELKDARYVTICLWGGLRKSETLGLQWKHITDKIHVCQQCQVNNKSQILPPKSECGVRDIPIVERLRPYLAERGSEEEYLFGKGEKPPTKYEFEKMLKRITSHVGDIESHVLRHTFITECAENDVPINVTQRLAGHAKPGITLDTYTHVTPKMMQNGIQKLNSL